MMSTVPRHFIRGCLVLLVTVALPRLVIAQTTPPTPNVSIQKNRAFWFNAWPVDLNRDGRTDLVAGAEPLPRSEVPSDLLVAIGRGDGSFNTPRRLGIAAQPVGTGDFNGDSRTDVVILRATGGFAILPSNGDGTFGAARNFGSTELREPFAVVADFNGDGHRDVATSGRSAAGNVGMLIFPGNGDFTFDSPVELATSDIDPVEATTGDFNKDGRRDLAVVTVCCSAFVFINRGGLLFDAREIFLNNDLADLTSADLNGDTNPDLIVAASFVGGGSPGARSEVLVLLGNGDGTFQEKVMYDTGVRGELTIVAGDFNRDSRLDIATGNWSVHQDDDFGYQLWDSISIMPGDGKGRLLRAMTFALGTVNQGEADAAWVFTHNSLNTSDLNGDRQADLIASPGAILLNAAAAANRAPTASAGPDIFITPLDDADFNLRGSATDPDRHWLTYTWTDQTGTVIGNAPLIHYSQPRGTTRTYTLTVSDGHGGTASDSVTVRSERTDIEWIDVLEPAAGQSFAAGAQIPIRWSAHDLGRISTFRVIASPDNFSTVIFTACSVVASQRECIWTQEGPAATTWRAKVDALDSSGNVLATDTSDPFTVTSAPGGTLPSAWDSRDVGAVGAAGSASFANGIFTVRGSGADVWGAADEFHFVSQPRTFGDDGSEFEITARVASVQNVNQWTKVGVMVRSGFGASATHASLFVTPTTVKGIAFQRRRTSGGTSVSTAGPAITAPVWLKLTVTGSGVRAFYRQGTGPWTFIGQDTAFGLVGSLRVGLVVSSHVDGTLARATFNNVSIRALPEMIGEDIGNVGAAGTSRSDTVVHTIEGSGAGIWGTADAFRFHRTQWDGNGTITARVRSVENTSTGAKAGLMFRESPYVGSPHVMLIVYAAGGVALQSRAASDGQTVENARRSGSAPEWLRLTKAGNAFTAAASNDGVTWTTVGQVTVSLDSTAFAGFAVTSRVAGTLATAVFDDLWIRP